MTSIKGVRGRKEVVQMRACLVICWLVAASQTHAQQPHKGSVETNSHVLTMEGGTATFTTPQMMVVVSKGQVTRILIG